MLNRRTLLRHTAVASAALACTPVLRALVSGDDDARSAVIALRRSSEAPFSIPADFMGLGYEMSSVATIGLLSATNDRYVQLVRQLGKRGVLRVGGIVADYTRYEPNGKPMADMHNTVVTRAALEQFAGFLRKVNWSTIWSVNFAQGTIGEAVEEATAVHAVLGSSLLAFEIGNEVENYAHGKPFRKEPYTYEQYRMEYKEWRAAILKAVPDARFAAPDTAGDVGWVESMAKDAHGEVQLLTTHYYRNDQKRGSPEQLTHADPKLLDKLLRLRIAAKQSGIPWRMCETNSFSGGGRPGVSDTLLGALWTIDFLCLLARYGCSGVNIETGVNQLGFVSSYSPVQDDGHGNNTAGVPYYGMLAFALAQAGCTQAIPLEMPVAQTDVTAYAFGNQSRVRSIVLVNRSPNDIQVSTVACDMQKASILRLTGTTADRPTEVTLGGAAVEPTGHWSASTRERLVDGLVHLPAMSCVLARKDQNF